MTLDWLNIGRVWGAWLLAGVVAEPLSASAQSLELGMSCTHDRDADNERPQSSVSTPAFERLGCKSVALLPMQSATPAFRERSLLPHPVRQPLGV
ncbi:MAG: hypothetical protein ACJA00_004953, partial [Myxococcota bacterium]